MNRRISIVSILLIMQIIGCQPNMKFNKTDWNSKEDWDYPYREDMLNDLVKNHKIKGLTYHQLIDSIGKPEHDSKGAVFYNVITDFGSDIDPVYIKTLTLHLNKDSIVNGFEVVEWKNN